MLDNPVNKIVGRLFLLFACFSFLLSCSGNGNGGEAGSGAAETKRPNVLLVVVDDVAFNDLGIFGGEINTPVIDSLAREGVVLTNFHAAPNCSPTRAMLFSGTDSHIAGLGNMFEDLVGNDNQRGNPGYEGYLNFRVAALSELFKDAGYHTYMTGKWHLGLEDFNGPDDRGFERSFTMLEGGAGAFSNMLALFGARKAFYREDGKLLDSLPDDFYSTRHQAEKMIEYIGDNHGDGKPFFSYLAFTSPHWPLQAPEASIARYKGKYDEGYDVLKARRLQALQDRGLAPADIEPFPRFPGEKPWDELTGEEKRYQAKLMEIYAAMIDDVDIYLGKVIAYLKQVGEYENTFIFFMSDNGPEGHYLSTAISEFGEYIETCCDNSYENIGKANSYVFYGQNWAQAGNTPLRMYKGYPSQGGVRVPAFAHYPKGIESGLQSNQVLSVMDVMPTLLELAGIQHPGKRYRDRDVVEMRGSSMLSLLEGSDEAVHPDDYVIGWELFNKRAIRKGDWKIIYEPYHIDREPRHAGIKTDTWQLYNLAEDPVEMNDLSGKHPGKLAEMLAHWHEYVEENGVIFPERISGY